MSLSKPDIYFPAFPLINAWIEADYNDVKTPEELTAFIHNGLNVIETTQNEIKKIAYKKIIYPLLSIQTGKSYESELTLD